MGYGIDAPSFNANPNSFSPAPNTALAQSGSSQTGQSYTPVPRVVALIDANGNVNSSTASYNVFNTNNPRSVYTADGINFYISGQGTGCDLTSKEYSLTTPRLPSTTAPIAITGWLTEAAPTATCVASGYTGSACCAGHSNCPDLRQYLVRLH